MNGMNHAKLLDCTLRDGAYIVDKTFGEPVINGIISGLVDAKVDFIEIGFLQNEGFGEGKTVFKNSRDARKYIPDDKNGVEFAVLADFSRYDIENLDDYDNKSFDAVRECFFKAERFDAVNVCKKIKEKGYKLFVQPVDILGYTDMELIEFIDMVNEVEPYCLSIVDTFGSMYQEDLHRIFELINHNLTQNCKIGFHSHNNMQLSNALTQEFIRMTVGKREIVVDGTLNGMGRGAGNTPTELIAQYMVSKLGYVYDMDSILDTIDIYMDNIKSRCDWGYTMPFFVAGCYSAHVNNVNYLSKKNSIRSKDIRYILNAIGAQKRKRYDYKLLEDTYMELLDSNIDDENALSNLKKEMMGKNVLIIAPGNSTISELEKIEKYINNKSPVVISVNFIHDNIKSDYIYMSNIKRFNYWKSNPRFRMCKKIITSNIVSDNSVDNAEIVNFVKLVKCGWEHLDNSTIMLLRLLDLLDVSNIAIAGLDGYDYTNKQKLNYINKEMELQSNAINPLEINKEISEMLVDYFETRKNKECPVEFITTTRFSN